MAEQEQARTPSEPEPDVRESFKGRIVSDPTLGTTKKGKAKFYAKVEQRHWHYELDGTYTRLPNTYHDLVAYKGTAVRAYKQFAKGDYFIAEGRMEEYASKATGEMKKRFNATGFGHNMAYTRYEVDRSPRHDAAERPTAESQAVSHDAAGSHGVTRQTPQPSRAADSPSAGRGAGGVDPYERRQGQQSPAIGL